MIARSALFIVVAFLLGVVSTVAISSYLPQDNPSVTTTTSIVERQEEGSSFVTRILGTTNEEQSSPYDHISERDITVEKDKVTIKINNPQWSKFTDTNSMDPVIDKGANAIQFIPKNEADIHVGDIVSYESEYAAGTIIHRVVAIDYDDDGWYATMKGDNNNREDPGKIRFSQIKRVVIAIIY